jgi:hypothetical protein
VDVQRATAGLVFGRDHLEPVPREYAGRRHVHVAERRAHHTAAEEQHASAALAFGRDDGGQRVPAQGPPRDEGRHVREAPERDAVARERTERRTAHARTERRRARGEREQPRPRQEEAEEERTRRALAARLRTLRLHLGARGLDELPELHPGRTRRLARAAVEALVDVLVELRADRDAALVRGLHQPDPAARVVHLHAEHDVGRARREAQPAMDALTDEAPVRRVGAGDVARERRRSRPEH